MTEPADALDAGAGETIRVPRNIMGLLRQSYDTREKILDWMLAIGVALTLAWLFRDQILACLLPNNADPNHGREDAPFPSQDVEGAIPSDDRPTAQIYTYNLPSSRSIKFGNGPSSTPPPLNPGRPPTYP